MTPSDLAAYTAPTTNWSALSEGEHFVQFYDDERVLLDSVNQYVAANLASGAAAIVIATRAHLDELERRWPSAGLDLEGARERGQYVGLDAAATLSKLLLDDWPQARRFADVIAPLVATAIARYSRVACFGEMVALLWQEGRRSAAIQLEALWNDLHSARPFSLFCAYPMSVRGDSHAESLREVCGAHSHVIPAESYTALTDPAERLAEICQLQHKARALEHEVLERRAIARELASRERELTDFLESALEGLHRVGPDGTILWANRAELALLGYASEEYVGHSITEFHADTGVIADILRRLLAGETLYDQPARLRCKDGSIKEVLIHSNALWEDGKFLYTRCFTRDVTATKRLEADLQRKLAQLAESDRRKDEFLAMLSHELRNPLAPIRNVAELLRLVDRDDPRYPELCDVLARQVGQIARLVDDLLDASRITQGKIQLQCEPLELMAILSRAIESSRPLINTRCQRLSVSLPEDPLRVHGDLTRLNQALTNLLNNAAKYTPAGGHIHVAAMQEGDTVAVRIRDNGIGIAAEMLPRVFDLFAQADQTLERSEGGLGIGLTLVRRIVEMHEGEVEAFSDGLGRGSEFVVRLPALDEAAALHRTGSAKTERPIRSRRILVIDDNRDAAESLGALLEFKGHEIATAFDGPAALQAIQSFPAEVILLDIGLPGMSGYQIAKRLRAGGSTARLVALTGYGQREDRERSRLAGFDHHLVKPVSPEDLDQVLI